MEKLGMPRQPSLILECGLLLALLAVNLAVFLPSLRGDFIWDDRYFVSQNQHVMGPHFLKTFLFSPYGGPAGFDENSLLLGRAINFYRPFTSLSYWLDLKVWGLNPAAFHLTNILIHTASAIVIYLILKTWGWASLASFAASLLFSIFPPHFENVAWISGRTDLVSFFFGALALLFFSLLWKDGRFFYLPLSSAFYLFSLLAKETAVGLPVIFFLFLITKIKSISRVFLYTLAYVPSFLGWFFLRRLALGPMTWESTGRTLDNLISTIGFYAARTLFPFNLSITVDSQRVFDSQLYFLFGLIFFLFFFASSFLALAGRTNWMMPALFLSAYLLLLLPSSLVIFFPSTVSYIAWRFLYWPSAVAIPSLLFLGLKYFKKSWLAAGAVSVLAVLFAAEIYPRAALFGQDEKGFWLGIKNIEREDILARFNIGIQNLGVDEAKAKSIFERILADRRHHLHDVWEIRIYEELAEYYTFRQQFAEAEKYFARLFQLRPVQSPHAYFNYAYFLALQGRRSEGEKYVQEMLRLFPQNHLVLIHAAKFYLLLKDYEQALVYLRKDYELFPNPETEKLLAEVETLARKRG